eukprot:g48328.t1
MSNEESYKAIIRYLTNEKEPYAPGTEGNVKRKIRKAAACYVVRRGTLYYQKKRKDRDEFDELEVVLEAKSRRELIASFHQSAKGFHLTREQTWKNISQNYWWRGIFKQVKDYIRECIQCKEKVDRNKSVSADTMEILEQLGIDTPVVEDSNETDDDLSNSEGRSGAPPRPTRKKNVSKQELVFVDSKGLVKQESEKHCQVVLEQLNVQRLLNQFCDVTLLIEGEEYKAHKSILAASSEYFRELFIEKGAVSSHEAVVDLSGFNKTSFLPLLEFAYTSVLAFDFCHMADVATLARHLLMHEVLEICEHIHKQLEERKITVYQKGDVKTLNSRDNTQDVEIPIDNTVEHQELETNENTDDGSITMVLQESEQIPVSAEGPPSSREDETLNEVAMHESEETQTAEELSVQQSQGILDCPAEGSNDENQANVNEHPEPMASSSRHMFVRINIFYLIVRLCEKEFLYKASLLSHLLRHKRNNEQIDESPGGRTKRQFICDICGKTLPKPYNLRLHMLKHTGVKPHMCK